MKNDTDNQSETRNLGILSFSPKVKKCVNIFSLSVLLILSGGDLPKIDIKKDLIDLNIKSKQENKTFSELKYYYIQQNSGIVKAIQEKFNDCNKKFPQKIIKKYEDDIIYYSSEILEQNNTDTLVFTLTKERVEQLGILKDSISGLISARYGVEYPNIQNSIKSFQDGIEKPNEKLIIKFIKLDNGDYIISNISIVHNKKNEINNDNKENTSNSSTYLS